MWQLILFLQQSILKFAQFIESHKKIIQYELPDRFLHKLLHDNPNVIETTGYVLNKLLPDDPKINFPLKIMCHSIN